MNTTMSEQNITPRQWAKAVTVLEGWRRYCKKRDSIRVRKIIERNHREMAQGATPMPPLDEPARLAARRCTKAETMWTLTCWTS
jgi:hypothetical protein